MLEAMNSELQPVLAQGLDALVWAEPHQASVRIALLSTGVLFMTGLLTGLWKYLAIAQSPQARAPYYVDIAHRASLLYAFAALLMAAMAALSPWSPCLTWLATTGPIVFFFAAVFTYLIHGWLNDTRNQLAKPHRLGRFMLPGWAIHSFMGMLALVSLPGSSIECYKNAYLACYRQHFNAISAIGFGAV